MTMGESRQELLAWLNDLLQLNYTKIEQVGTGAALCQIFDSIYGDVPLSKVKFNTIQEYEYVNNYKVLQKTFIDHKVEKVVPVERLVKCRFQDNLEFLQWVKRYWDTYFPGGNYDAAGRRKGNVGAAASSRNAPISNSSSMKKTLSNTSSFSLILLVISLISVERLSSRKPAASPAQLNAAHSTRSSAKSSASGQTSSNGIQELSKQITQLQVTVDGLEKERDFYFAKLRDVEILVQSWFDGQTLEPNTEKFCKEIQEILYSTEDGFEIPPEDQVVQDETF